MKREAKEMRLVYRDFLLDVNQSHSEVVALEADLSRKHGLMSKSTSKRYYQVVILFSRLFCLTLVSIDYI